MIDILRLGVILGTTFLGAVVTQKLWDQRARRRLDRAAARLGLEPGAIPKSLLRELPFLSTLADSIPTSRWGGSIDGAEASLIALRAPAGRVLGYTLLARRSAAWSARAIVRPDGLRGGPPAGGPDPRRLAELGRPELVAALARASAWLHCEGPWRVVGTPALASAAAFERLAAVQAELPTLAPEPSEFSGGLEWNV